MDRRRFLQSSSVLAALSGCAVSETNVQPTIAKPPTGRATFLHGVASGDPLADRVILWTRVSPTDTSQSSVTVNWWVSPTPNASDAIASGTTQAQASRDFTVKVDAAGLSPNTSYYYGFSADGAESTPGRTKTLPLEDVRSVRLAVTSCANHPQGYFNAYRAIAKTDDLDAVLSLGDYLYEYANSEYGNGEALNRIPEPNAEMVSLSDYRTRHAQYKTDPDLQAAHAAHPWIVVWDDHESTNNSWSGGAQNHNPEKGEGDWSVRRADAIRAYYEWMPIRDVPTGLFRSFRFGNLADLVMLDTRLVGRDEQGTREDFATANDPSRTLLGAVQEELFLNHLTDTQAADVQWKLVGQQVAFAPWSDDDQPFNPDSWSGYRHSRRQVLNHIKEGGIDNVVILSGDVHSSWGMEVPDETREVSQAIELVAPAVSSPPLASTSEVMQDLVARALNEQEHIKFVDGLNNGYLVVTVESDQTRADWYYTGDRTTKNDATLGKTMRCNAGSNSLG